MFKKIIIIPLFLIVILTNFYFLVFNENLYMKEAEQLGTTQYKEEYLNVISYLKGDEDLRFFNEKEKLHMEDVKSIIKKTIYLWQILILSLIIYFVFIPKKEIIPLLRQASVFTIIFLSLLIIFALISFDTLFLYFHKIFFTNDLWILNPETDLLINIFPQQFFINFTQKLIINSYITSIIILILTVITKNLKKRKLSILYG